MEASRSWSTLEDNARTTSLERDAMGTKALLLFVLGAVAPMSVIVALLPLSIDLGNGAGVPGTYLIAGAVLALFAVGYVRMTRRITKGGAFYVYATRGLGPRMGGATAYIALVAYNATTIGIFAGLAYFAHVVGASVADIDLPWQLWGLFAFIGVGVLSYFEIGLSAKVLGVLLCAEVLILLVFDAGVLIDRGFHGFSLDAFRPSTVFAGGFGVSLMLAFGSYVGFEATALCSEEVPSSTRSRHDGPVRQIARSPDSTPAAPFAVITLRSPYGARAAKSGLEPLPGTPSPTCSIRAPASNRRVSSR
jgi:amino acid transporter